MVIHNVVRGQKIKSALVESARRLRHEMTKEEKILWEELRRNRLEGLHFRRQQIIGSFIVDFYCHSAGLVVEVDGGVHRTQVERDGERDQALAARGLLALHFSNDLVTHGMDSVLATILEACRKRRT